MSKGSFEEDFESPNHIVTLPTVEFPAKKPKVDAIPPPLPPGDEVVDVDDIHEPPPPTLPLNPQVIPANNEKKCKSDKIGDKTKVLSEKNVASNSSTTSSNSEDAVMEKAAGSEANKSELDPSKNPSSKSWASSYLSSIGQSYRKPIKINFSARRNSTITIKESPQKDEDTGITNAEKKNQQVHKTESLVMQQPANDKLQTPNYTESNVTKCTMQRSVKVPVNIGNPYNLSDPLPTLPLPANGFSITNSSHTHSHMEQIAAHWPTPAPLNDIGYYNYNVTHNFTPTMPVTNYAPHLHPNIGYYHYNVHNNNLYSTDRAANDRSYLDKIDKFLAKVNTYDDRFDDTKTGKDVTHKKSLSLKRRASDALKPRCEIYQEDERDEVNKKSRMSEEILQTKDYNLLEKYKDFTKYTRKESSSVNTHEKEHKHEIKTNIKDIIKEKYIDRKFSYKNEKNDAIKEEHRSMGKTKRSTFEDPKEDDYCNPHKIYLCETKKKIARKERRSHSKSETDSTSRSPRRSEEPIHNESKTKRVGKERSSSYDSRSSKEPVHDEYKTKLEKTSKRKEKSSHSSRGSEEPAHIEYKIKRVDKEKAYKDKEKYSSNSSRRSEEPEHNHSKTKQINEAKASLKIKEKTPKKKVKPLSHSSRGSEEHELKYKTEQENKEKKPKDDRYKILKEKIKQKIQKAKDEMKRLRRRQEVEETSDENKPKKLDNQKPSTSKQGIDPNNETGISDKSVNCVAQINNNSKFYNMDEHFDLRSKLSRQNLNHYFGKIRDKNCNTTEIPLNRKKMFLSVANDCSDDALQVDKQLEKNARKTKNKKVKKIQLVINVTCEESDTSESEENTRDKENEKCSSFNAEDLSFLDDLNIDEIVNSLTSNKKEPNVSKISTHNDITNNTDEPYIISGDDSDASTVHLEEVDQAYDLVDNDELGKTEFSEEDTKNTLRDLVNINIPHAEQRVEEKNRGNKEHKIQEKDDMVLNKIKEEVSDEVNCTKCKKTENIPSEKILPKVDEKEMLKRLFTPMMEIKEESIEILSDDETSTNDCLDILNFEKHALDAAAAQNKVQQDTNLSKMTNTQVKMEPLNIYNVVPSNVVSTAKTYPELTVKENTAIFKSLNSNIPKNRLNETHLHVAIKNPRKEIEDKAEAMIEPNLKMNILTEIAKDCSSTINIVKDNAIISHLEMKVEPEETKCDNEVSLQRNFKLNAEGTPKDITIESVKDVLPEIGDTYDGSTNQSSKHAVTDIIDTAVNKDTPAILDNTLNVTESLKLGKKESDKETTKSEKATCDTGKKDHNENKDTTIRSADIADVPMRPENKNNLISESNKEHSVQIQQVAVVMQQDLVQSSETQKDFNRMSKALNEKIQPIVIKQTVTKADKNKLEIPKVSLAKDASNIVLNSKIASPSNKQPGLLPTPKPLNLLPTPKSSSFINTKSKSGLLPTPKSTSPANTPKTANSLLTPKSTSPARSYITANSLPILKQSSSPANTPETETSLPSRKSTSLANTPKTETSLPTPKSSSPANTPKTETSLPTPKSTNPANTPKTETSLPTPKSTSPANTPKTETSLPSRKSTSLANTPKTETSLHTLKSSSPANTPKTETSLPTPKSTNPANTPKTESSLNTPKSTSPANTPKTETSIPPPKSSSPANTPKVETSLPTPKSTSPANTPKTETSLPNPKSSSHAGTLKTKKSLPTPKSTMPANSPKNLLSNSKISTPANTITSNINPPPKSSSTPNNPQTKDANDGKPLRQTEKDFIEMNLKKRMEEYLKKPYDITELIHRGKFSKILKCRDGEGNDMVVKIMRVTCDRYMMGVMKEQMLENLQRDIPEENLHFIRLHDGFSVGIQWSFLMEYYPKNLSQALEESERPFHINHVQKLSKQLATAVAALRNHNIVHSDIKPSHVLLNSTNDHLKLCGFDEACYNELNPIPNIGTVNYRAPEIILGFSAGFSIDVWSTALVMYEMATKTKLFPGTFNNEILFKQICTIGYVPIDMITLSRFACKHFDGGKFMRRRGENGKDIALLGPEQIFKNSKLKGSLKGVYLSQWGGNVPKWQQQRDLNKVFQLYQLLEHMLVMHPSYRFPIEYVYASDFLLEENH